MTEDSPNLARRRFSIQGRVQGVGFRYWTMQVARALHLRGTVRNLADGRVEVEAAGTPDAVDRLLQRLQHGPPGARVDRVLELPPGDSPLPADFEVAHRW